MPTVPGVRTLAAVAATVLVVAVLAACSSTDGGDDGTADDTASTSTTAPDVIVVEDTVLLGLDGITATDGTVLLTYTADERACVARAAPDTPDPADDPDAEQAVAEAALGCLGFDRIAPVVTQQLAADDALSGVDPTCLAREVASLQDTPDILAAVLRGEPDTISVIASTASINCT